jgi:hypothetical protein
MYCLQCDILSKMRIMRPSRSKVPYEDRKRARLELLKNTPEKCSCHSTKSQP